MAQQIHLGAIVAGFRVKLLLGQGAMGTVYLAEDTSIKDRVALKVLAPELSRDERFRQRFLRETKLAAELDDILNGDRAGSPAEHDLNMFPLSSFPVASRWYDSPMIRKILVAMAVVAAAVATTASGEAAPGYSGFTAHVDNPWFPLLAGTQYRYTGVKDGKPSRDVVTVTHHTKTIDGAPCIVVHDRLYLRGRLAERTTDWYSQDLRGNVWYFGENTVEFDVHGHVTSNQGTWRAGVNGARPGIYMPAAPRVGQSGQQEYYKGQAEDHYKVIGLFRTVTTSGAKHILLTKEWTPLEPGVIDHKMYAFGIGTVLEQTEKGPEERNELVAVAHR